VEQTCREWIGGLLLHRSVARFLRSFQLSLSVMVMSPHALIPSAGTLFPRIKESLRRGNWA
jgi:hypothetical protein